MSKSILDTMHIKGFHGKEYELIVVGGGTAGIALAVSAAQQGLKVAIIERETFLGGTMTGAITQPMMGNFDECKTQWTEWLNPHFIRLVKNEIDHLRSGNAVCETSPIKVFDIFLDPFLLTVALENLAVSSGIDIWYSTSLISCNSNNRKIDSIVVSNKSGLIELKGRIFADCTGDLDLGVMAGLDFYDGTDPDKRHQAISLRFMMNNVDLPRVISFFEEKQKENILAGWIMDKEPPKGVISYIFKLFPQEGDEWKNAGFCNQFYFDPNRPGEVNFNCPEVHGFDATNGRDVSHVLIRLRKKVLALSNNMKKYYPGFENAYLSYIAPNLGIRDTKRLKGIYTFTEENVVDGAKFDDGIARGHYYIDIHLPGLGERVKGKNRPDEKDYYEIPYRCLISDKIDNYITAGRTVSSTFRGLAAVRIQNIVMGMGWAAGLATAISIKEKTDVNKINGNIIKQLLF
jgi:hypothetical protein